MKLAYADPPYVGQARKHYADDARAAEVNLPLLVAHLGEFDGWALSCSSPSLRTVLPLCPADARVGAWVKPWVPFKKDVGVAYGWEPVVFVPARRRTREDGTVTDWVKSGITGATGTVGAKPDRFCRWLFDVLGADPADEFHDLFPGSGAVERAWSAWRSQLRLEVSA